LDSAWGLDPDHLLSLFSGFSAALPPCMSYHIPDGWSSWDMAIRCSLRPSLYSHWPVFVVAASRFRSPAMHQLDLMNIRLEQGLMIIRDYPYLHGPIYWHVFAVVAAASKSRSPIMHRFDVAEGRLAWSSMSTFQARELLARSYVAVVAIMIQCTIRVQVLSCTYSA
jgi:hypothetical protein